MPLLVNCKTMKVNVCSLEGWVQQRIISGVGAASAVCQWDRMSYPRGVKAPDIRAFVLPTLIARELNDN